MKTDVAKPGSRYDETRLLFIPAIMRRPFTQPKVRQNALSQILPCVNVINAVLTLSLCPHVFVGYKVSTASEQAHTVSNGLLGGVVVG